MDKVHRCGLWTRGPCFVYVHLNAFLLGTLISIGDYRVSITIATAHRSGIGASAVGSNK